MMYDIHLKIKIDNIYYSYFSLIFIKFNLTQKSVRSSITFEEKLFLKLIEQYLSLLLSLLVSVREDEINSSDTMDRLNYQKRYCLNQKRNDKTRGILTKFFGSYWANEYINKILFEC